MDLKVASMPDTCELRPVVGLASGLAPADVETLTVNAIRLHRQLLEKADQLFQALPEDYRTGKATGGVQHLEYIEAMIEMHAQMSALNTLLGVLGYIPKMAAN
ncbi:transcriptional repressor TraM [Agrobacterium tumefaciens]|uniref:transcriptional repressor TraM n=1 Tax=Agrobacterium tumefaciens TaxID=358 RepID=UPI00023A227B|nr:transcriptional repressor [Agrobacterium tumefaciens 5A]